MKTLDVIKKAVEALKGPMEFRPRQVIISEEVLNIIAADILGQQREIEKLKGKLAISKSIARHYRKNALAMLKEQEAKPQKKGHWIKGEYAGDLYCSECLICVGKDAIDFCPLCGADMREGEQE